MLVNTEQSACCFNSAKALVRTACIRHHVCTPCRILGQFYMHVASQFTEGNWLCSL